MIVSLCEGKGLYFIHLDPCHKKLELLRELFHNPLAKSKELCVQYGISLPSYYRLTNDYKLYGPQAILSAPSYGKHASIGGDTELCIILEKLRNPRWTGQEIVDVLNLRCSRFVANRVLETWDLLKDKLKPVALDEYIVEEQATNNETFAAIN